MHRASLRESTRLTTDVATARAALARLYARQAEGAVATREFDRRNAELTVELYRALVTGRLPRNESIVAEHHVVLGHTKLTRSVLREGVQEAVSLFATQYRLLRVRADVLPATAPTGDSRDNTEIDEVPRTAITGLAVRRAVRKGEIAAGLAILALALVFRPWLEVTGTFMVALGVLGALHGWLLPTRWVEVEGARGAGERVFRVHAVRRRSARRLIEVLRAGPDRES